MKVFQKTVFLASLTIVLLSAVITGKNVSKIQPLNYAWSPRDDTSNLIRLVRIDSFKLPIIPPSSGVQFFKDKIVFLSLSKNERKMSPNQISFGTVEAYYASVEDSVPGKHLVFSALSSFSYPCEAITFSRDYNTIYFSKLDKKDKKEKIFMAKFTADNKTPAGLVTETFPLDFCTGNFNYSHPALSSDEDILIFASDKDGSPGGMDLFLTRRSGEKWSAPENLGKSINTAGNEFFPFLDSANNLYFSSDGLPGYGGYDVFTCKFNGTTWDKAINMAAGINSLIDDIAFTINKLDGKTAFFTRRQISRSDESQLFRVSLKEKVADRILLSISYVFNGKPVPKTSLSALNTVIEVKPAETEPLKTKPESRINLPDAKAVTAKPTKPASVEQKAVVKYRVQILPDAGQRKSREMVINGTSYKLSEYVYLGAKRYTIGEFGTLAPAAALQRICRQSGYPQSFVVAFKNNERSLDPKLFK